MALEVESPWELRELRSALLDSELGDSGLMQESEKSQDRLFSLFWGKADTDNDGQKRDRWMKA